jgi:hypothetical protein
LFFSTLEVAESLRSTFDGAGKMVVDFALGDSCLSSGEEFDFGVALDLEASSTSVRRAGSEGVAFGVSRWLGRCSNWYSLVGGVAVGREAGTRADCLFSEAELLGGRK